MAGFYRLVRLKSYEVLKSRSLLKGIRGHVLLTDYADSQSTGTPFHIRHGADNGRHREELEQAGFHDEGSSRIENMPHGTVIGSADFWREMASENDLKEFWEGNELGDIHRHYGERAKDLLQFPKTNSPIAKKKKRWTWTKKLDT